MRILIVSATRLEIRPLLSFLGCAEDEHFSTRNFHFHRLNLDILITGVGLMHTAFFMGKTLACNQYDLAVNLGIAGSFQKTLSIGEVVNVTEERIADLGVEGEDNFSDIVELNLLNPDQFPYKSGKLVNRACDVVPEVANLKKVKGVSVNKANGNQCTIDKIIQKYYPDVESMEGAAFLYACLCENIPCLQIRAISNYIEQLNKEAWNIPLAVQNLNETAIKLVNLLTNPSHLLVMNA